MALIDFRSIINDLSLQKLLNEYSKKEFEKEITETNELSQEDLQSLVSSVFQQYEQQQAMSA